MKTNLNKYRREYFCMAIIRFEKEEEKQLYLVWRKHNPDGYVLNINTWSPLSHQPRTSFIRLGIVQRWMNREHKTATAL